MPRKRIYELARELGMSTRDLILALEKLGMPGMSAFHMVSEEEAEVIRGVVLEKAEAQPPRPAQEKAPPPGKPRPPVVAVLGHIDHGKTTLLDRIRKTRVAAGEPGGITQSIGAYQAQVDGKLITFIDTPGHRAFTAMRARGAKATDIAVLVVAADDGVMAQTLEALDHIKAAGVPMIVAINKVDKPESKPEMVKQQLANLGYIPEDWGGNTIMVPISALTGQGVDELLEMILLVAELEGVSGDPEGALEAIIIESHLDPAKGPVVTAIVKNGTLRERDVVVAGTAWGRIRALLDHQGKRIPAAGPGTPVQILGLSEVPAAGEKLERVASPKEAEELVEKRREEEREKRLALRPRTTFDELIAAAQTKKLVLIIKAHSVGALEAVKLELSTIQAEGVELEILHAGVGQITESDVLLAVAESQGQPLILGFGVKVDPKAQKLAEQKGIPIRTYDIIYDLTLDVERALKRLLGPEFREVKVGEVEVLKVFNIAGVGKVAGCAVRAGRVVRGAKVRVLRRGEEVFVGEIASLKRFAEDVKEVREGYECGIRVRDFEDVREGDVLEVYVLEEVPV
ncbi:MAG: translation initiation factor IF-2 [Candidatus Bipolaricaulota bacterium]|nr:translation initiation factor IF-2 [Candidatus Bipolaricaulota bacterium]MDW8127030.1 translation initiation factor IF-2 [Candidatus Bipolaricaulota bacterium]